MTNLSEKEWDDFLESHPAAHILQTSAWGNLKSKFGWKIQYVKNQSAGAMILYRSLPLGLSIGYIPKGPVGENWLSLWNEIDALNRKRRAVFLKVEPDLWHDRNSDFERYTFSGFVSNCATTQPRRTILVSLKGNEDEWLGRMKQKTRYNIRLAEKKGVSVRVCDDLDTCGQLMKLTGTRDGFGVHAPSYYRYAYNLFQPKGNCELLMAYYDNRPLAGLMLFMRKKRAWYLFGGSNNEERNRMPAYLLQWEAMRLAASRGCEEYDLWGVPDENEDILERRFEVESGDLWGVYRFKRGFGGNVCRSTCAYERVYMPFLYKAYRLLLKRKEE